MDRRSAETTLLLIVHAAYKCKEDRPVHHLAYVLIVISATDRGHVRRMLSSSIRRYNRASPRLARSSGIKVVDRHDG